MVTKLEAIPARLVRYTPTSGDVSKVLISKTDYDMLMVAVRAAAALVAHAPTAIEDRGWEWCVVCDGWDRDTGEDRYVAHRPDCKWLLAKAALAPLLEAAE
jgi:hypothetical protein